MEGSATGDETLSTGDSNRRSVELALVDAVSGKFLG